MPRSLFSSLVLAGVAVCAAAQSPPILPLREVHPGMRAVGKTVFAGGRVEEFQVEVLGILENMGPKQSVILARLSGGPLEKTGVMQGMSGSPVYYNGKLMGAVALSFPFSKEPIAGIRPIEEMLASAPSAPRQTAALSFPYNAAESIPKQPEFNVGAGKLLEIATPFWISGFTRGTFDYFAPILRAAGLEPVQGISGGGSSSPGSGTPPKLEPGSMISVQLVTGDMSVGADGTVTHIDGNKVYAFGHRFMSAGDTELPFSRAEVITLLASQNQSFKISNSREWLGTITHDRSVAVSGELGRRARMMPLTVRVKSPGRNMSYNMQVAQDRLFTPLLLQMAVYSAIDATERTVGLSSITMKGKLLVDGAPAIPFSNVYSSELGAPNLVSAAVAAPVSALLQSGFDSLVLRGLEMDIEVSNDKKALQLDSVWTSRRDARPGETVEITASFTGDHGLEVTRTIPYTIPIGAPVGALYFTVTDGPSANMSEFRQFLITPPRSAPQLLAFLNGLHPNDRAYVRVWRQQNSWQVQGENLPNAPPSMALAFSRTASLQANTRVADLEMPPAGFSFTGSKTVQVDVKE